MASTVDTTASTQPNSTGPSPDWAYHTALRVGAVSAFGAVLLSENAESLSNLLLVPAALSTLYLLLCALWSHVQLLTAWIIFMTVLVGITVLLTLLGSTQDWSLLGRYALNCSCFALALAGRRSGVGTRLIPLLAAGLIAAAVIYTGMNGFVYASDYPRFAPFYGGELALHSSALVVCAATVAVYFSPWRLAPRFLWTGAGVIMQLGYSTVTVLIMTFIILAISVFYQRRWPLWILVATSIIALWAAIVFRDRTAVAGGVSEQGIGAMGSGRLDSWVQRISLFFEHPLFHKLIGTGPGSDKRSTELWWWDPLVAHSEILTILMEFGLYGLLAAAAYFGVLIRLANVWQKIVLGAFLVGAAMSNVILERPTLALVWGFVLLSMSRTHRHVKPLRSRDATPETFRRRPQAGAGALMGDP